MRDDAIRGLIGLYSHGMHENDTRRKFVDAAEAELAAIGCQINSLHTCNELCEEGLAAKDEALKPFAIHADYFYHSKADNESALTNMLCDVVHTVSVGAFKQAKAALSPPTGKVLVDKEEIQRAIDTLISHAPWTREGLAKRLGNALKDTPCST